MPWLVIDGDRLVIEADAAAFLSGQRPVVAVDLRQGPVAIALGVGQRRNRIGAACQQRQDGGGHGQHQGRSKEHTSELQSLMRISYAVFCLKKKTHGFTSDHESAILYI